MNFKVLILSFCLIAFLGCSNETNNKREDPSAYWHNRVAKVYSELEQTGVQIKIHGEVIVDLAETNPITTSYGIFRRGTTLNLFVKDGVEFLVYGEDGVFAAECEPNPNLPDFNLGPDNPYCEKAHAESFDTLIICFSGWEETPIMQSQKWEGVDNAFGWGKGMRCTRNGTFLKSYYMYTY